MIKNYMNPACSIYILKCVDNSYYVGHAENVELRILEHQSKVHNNCYTANRLPIQLLFVKEFPTRDEAFKFERQIKGWSRAKKEALIHGGFEAVRELNQKIKK